MRLPAVKKLAGQLTGPLFFFKPTFYLYNRATEGVKRTKLFNSLVLKYPSVERSWAGSLIASQKFNNYLRFNAIASASSPLSE
jgi:hypothetical protein